MLWALCGRISNYGDNGPLGYVLSSCGSRSQDFCTFIKFHLSLLCTKLSINIKELKLANFIDVEFPNFLDKNLFGFTTQLGNYGQDTKGKLMSKPKEAKKKMYGS